MKLYILYEKVNIELAGKILLSKFIINNSRNIKEVVLGHYRQLLAEILITDNPSNTIVLFKDIYKTSESLIDILNLRGIKYFAYHEEEHRLFNFHKTEEFYKDLINPEYIKKIGSFLSLSERTKEFFYNHHKKIPNLKISIVGNPKYDYIKLLRENYKKNKKKDNNYNLFALTESFFKCYKFYHYVKKNNLNLNDLDKINFAQYNLKEMYCQYVYTKEKLKFFIKMAKNNPSEIFLLRPHPSEKENLERLKKLFKKLKNVEVNLDGDLYNCILNSKLVISGPSSSIIDSLILEKPFLIFYDPKNHCHFHSYGAHPTTKFEEKFINFNQNIIDISNLKVDIGEKENKLILDYTNYEINSYEKIFKIIENSTLKKIKYNTLKENIFKIFFKPAINQIIQIRNRGIFGIRAYKIFKEKTIFKILKYSPYIFFRSNSSKNFFFRHILKLIVGTSENKIPDEIFHSGELEKIDTKIYNLINDVINKNSDFQDTSNSYLDHDQKKIFFSNTN